MNFNPMMFNQFNSMDPNMMKSATDMISGMSDEELKNYMKMAGMGNMNPEMLRASANMMKNMNPNQFSQMKDMASKMSPGQFPTNPNASNPSSSTNTSSSTKIDTPTFTTQNSSSSSSSRYPKIEKLKNEGNEHFKKGNYDDASASYFEAILEIEELKMKKNYDAETLNPLEVSCRSNYANVKAKLEDFDIVLNQANEILKIQPQNGKALFRLGQAYHHLQKYDLASDYLNRSLAILKDDQTIKDYIQKNQQKIKESELKRTEKTNISHNSNYSRNTNEDNKKVIIDKEESAPKQNTQNQYEFSNPVTKEFTIEKPIDNFGDNINNSVKSESNKYNKPEKNEKDFDDPVNQASNQGFATSPLDSSTKNTEKEVLTEEQKESNVTFNKFDASSVSTEDIKTTKEESKDSEKVANSGNSQNYSSNTYMPNEKTDSSNVKKDDDTKNQTKTNIESSIQNESTKKESPKKINDENIPAEMSKLLEFVAKFLSFINGPNSFILFIRKYYMVFIVVIIAYIIYVCTK